MLDDELRSGNGPDYWNSIGATWSRNPQLLWREHSDAVNCALLARWIPERGADCALKTDMFDEMCSAGLYPFLALRARRFVGIDMSVSVLRSAKSRHAGIHAVAADARQLPFAGEMYDLIVSNSTLDHFESVDEIRKALAELLRVLRPEGELIITMDNPENPIIALRNALPFRLFNRLGITPYYVGATLNARELRLLLEETGFRVMESASIMHCPRVFAVALANLLQRYAPSWMQQGFLRSLMAFEHLGRLPSHRLTSHFTAARATKAGPSLDETTKKE